MAYVSQELKKKLAPGIKAVLAKYKLRGSIAVHNNSTLVVNIKSGALNFIDNIWAVAQDKHGPQRCGTREKPTYIQVNESRIHDNCTGVPRECLLALKTAMCEGNWDKSDIQTDYFNVGWYTNINVGSWDAPYILTQD